MAIGFNNASFGTGTTGVTHNLTHTCTGGNLILWYSCLCVGVGDTITSVTYNGVSMTRAGYVNGDTEGIYLYYLINPATGTNTITATTSSNVTIYPESASYTGVKQSGQPDNVNTTAYSNQTNLSTTVTTVADNCWLVGVFRAGSNQTAIAGTTLRGGVNATIQLGDSNGDRTPAGSQSLGVNFTTSTASQIVASFSPLGVSVPNSGFFMFF